MRRLRCGKCGRSRPEDETALITGHRSGNYRRAIGRADRRVCIDCTKSHVDYVRKAQGEQRNTSLDDSYFCWSQAAKIFEIDVSDLWRSEYDRKKRGL